MPTRDARRAVPWPVRLLTLALLVPIVAVPGAGVSGPMPVADGTAASGAASVRLLPASVGSAREVAVRDLLAARATAMRRGDRTAFLATVDPRSGAFRGRQRRLFDALRTVPLDSWRYELDAGSEQAADPDVDRLRGPGWWAPAVTLRYALSGEGTVASERQHLTFVPRRGRWLLAADDDFVGVGGATPRDLWDEGRVVTARGAHSLVLGHPGSQRLLRSLASAADAAVPRVDAVWGTAWARRVVVVVPETQAELGRLLGWQGDLSQVAAVATAQLDGQGAGYHPVGHRILLNPRSFDRLSPLGRQVVLTHEVTHVASRASTGPGTPTWLAEGLADYVAYRGLDVPLSTAAHDLRTAVRAGHAPMRLPTDADFDAASSSLTAAYEQAWLAVGLLAERYGTARLLRFYRLVGRAGGSAHDAVGSALRSVYGLSEAAFVADWRRTTTNRLR